jgi:hypothetical protein
MKRVGGSIMGTITRKDSRPMPRDTLFLLNPDFMDEGKGPYYCPACASIEGLLCFYSRLRQLLDVRYVAFSRPRPEVVALIGDVNQGLPVLVLDDAVPADTLIGLDVKAWNGRRFLKSTTDIGRYLARTHGIGEPH